MIGFEYNKYPYDSKRHAPIHDTFIFLVSFACFDYYFHFIYKGYKFSFLSSKKFNQNLMFL